jgi:hypothetical protein
MKRGALRGRAYRVFLITACFAVCAASGCSSPFGSIGGILTDLFWVVPDKDVYDLGEEFLRGDMQVFVSYRGVEQTIPVDKVVIGIAEDPELPDNLEYIPVDGNYPLENEGEKLVVVEYGSMSASYSIKVVGSGGEGGPPVIGWIWVD